MTAPEIEVIDLDEIKEEEDIYGEPPTKVGVSQVLVFSDCRLLGRAILLNLQ